MSKMKRYRIRTLVTVFFLIVSFIGYAQPCTKTLKIYANDNWFPYSYVKDGVYQGLEIEVLKKVLSDADLCWHFVSYPSSSRAIREFQKHNVDVLFAASYTRQRDSFSDFSLPYRQETMTLFGKKDKVELLATNAQAVPQNIYPSLRNTIVAVNRGSVYGGLFQHFRRLCSDCVVELNLAQERFELVMRSRADFLVEDFLSGLYLISHNSEYKNSIKASPFTIHQNPVHYMLRSDVLSKDEFSRLNYAIRQNQYFIEQTVEQYFQKYAQRNVLLKTENKKAS